MVSELQGIVELAFWTSPKGEPPAVARTRDLLVANGFVADRADPIPDSTAFRRAADSLRGKDMLVRPFKRNDLLAVQVDRETVVNDELDRLKIGVYVQDGSVIGAVNGGCVDTLFKLRESYHAALSTYTWGDVSQVIIGVLKADGLGAYSPKSNGGVYFCPVASKSVLDRLESFATGLGMRFLRYSVPNTEAHKAEVSDAIAMALGADLQAHADAIAGYDNTSRLGILDNRGEAIESTRKHIESLSLFLGDAKGGLLAQVNSLVASLAAKRVVIESNPAPRQGRRIVAGVS